MKNFTIPPNSAMELMHEGNMGYFCLAQHYYSNEAYRKFFKEQKAKGAWILMDNGSGDHALITEDILIECAKDLQPNEIVPPDILFDLSSTLNALDSFVDRMRREGLDHIEVFAVPQGADRHQWIACYVYMLLHPKVKTIGMSKLGIPKAFLGEAKNDQGIMEARHMAVDYLLDNDLLKKPLHFLGMGNPLEFQKYVAWENPLFRSTDSCNSIWSAMNGQNWREGQFDRIPTPKDYFERTIDETQKSLAKMNIDWFKTLLEI